jgi:hypothetical protein
MSDTLIRPMENLIQIENEFVFNSLNYHRTHENKEIRFENYKYLISIYKDKSHHKVFKKGTQSKISEYLMAFAIDKALKNNNVLYVLPTDVIKTRYVTSRVNKTVEFTEFYSRALKDLNSASMKGFNNGLINFIGSHSEANFAEFVAQIIIIDEKNLCNLDNVKMAKERQSSQEMEDRYTLEAANPTICDYAIDVDYENSDQKKWYNKCECGHRFEIDFFKHIVRQEDNNEYVIIDKDFDWSEDRDCYIICDKCGKPIDRRGEGLWVPESKSSISGYHFNQFFTSPTPVRDQLAQFQKGLTDERELQRFYNASLGLSYTSAGARITRDMMTFGDYPQLEYCKNPCLIGLDVGADIHYIIGELLSDRTIRIIKIGKCKEEKEVFELNKRYNILIGIIDALPETRISRRICATLKGYWMAEYLTEAKKDIYDMNAKIIKVDRTSSLDLLKEAVLLKNIIFPQDKDKELIAHFEASTRVWQENDRSENGGRWQYVHSKPDHFFHCANYMNMCKRLLAML